MREIALESRAEIDMPAPEPAEEGLGILVVVRAEFAGGAGGFVHGDDIVSSKTIYSSSPSARFETSSSIIINGWIILPSNNDFITVALFQYVGI